jgi:hypothetical protein
MECVDSDKVSLTFEVLTAVLLNILLFGDIIIYSYTAGN